MKKIISCILTILILTSICLAETSGGDTNIEGGGGGMGDGSGDSFWSFGNDGVRVTILENGVPLYTADLANKDNSSVVGACFKKQTKLSYRSGASLIPQLDGVYTNAIPPVPLPTIISKTGGSTIDSIRSYFTDKQPIQFIAEMAGLTFEELTDGTYKLLLEPIAYFTYKGVFYAMTATEAALYDQKVSGDLKYWMGKLTHQNLPFSMFLERADLGIQPWTGGTTGKQDNSSILALLGVGVVSFRYTPEQEPEAPLDGSYTYRTDTDVITSVLIQNPGPDITPDSGAQVSFTILGQTYSKQFVCPSGSQQLVWVQWHTPSIPNDFTITISAPATGTYVSLPVTVGTLPDIEPPNPVYDGPSIDAGQYQPNFKLAPVPNWGSQTTATWRQWYPEWNPPKIIPHYPKPIIIPGYWSFFILEYGASLNVDYDLIPALHCPTAVNRGMGNYEIKAGYGVLAQCKVKVSGIGGVSNYDVTSAQSGLAVFPDWKFQTYDRVLEPADPGRYMSEWSFRVNPYSYYGERVHFTPIWYPGGKYPVPLAIFDVWTPVGQLYAAASDYVDVKGDMLDDWYIRVIE